MGLTYTMRRIVISMHVTLDGFMAGLDDSLTWQFDYWNQQMSDFALDELSRADTILLGHNTYRVMADYWPITNNNNLLSRGDLMFAGMMNRYKKIVCSGSLTDAHWENTTIITHDFFRYV